MIDRPDRDIETSAAGAARHRQGDGDRKNEVSLPYPSRPHRGLHLECGISNVDRARAGEDFMAANADIFISMSWLIIGCARVDLALMPQRPLVRPENSLGRRSESARTRDPIF
jgi:hypothetical protein